MGVLHRLQVEICSTVDLHGCRGTAGLTMGRTRGCRGISVLALGATPVSPSALTLVSTELFVSWLLTLQLWLLLHVFFFLLIKYMIRQLLPPPLVGLALASSRCVWEPAGLGSVAHRGSFWRLLTEATPVALQDKWCLWTLLCVVPGLHPQLQTLKCYMTNTVSRCPTFLLFCLQHCLKHWRKINWRVIRYLIS